MKLSGNEFPTALSNFSLKFFFVDFFLLVFNSIRRTTFSLLERILLIDAKHVEEKRSTTANKSKINDHCQSQISRQSNKSIYHCLNLKDVRTPHPGEPDLEKAHPKNRTHQSRSRRPYLVGLYLMQRLCNVTRSGIKIK